MGSGQINPAILAEEAQPSPEVANFRPQSQIKFNVTEVAPPSNLYVTQNDVMLLTLFDFIAGHTVFLDYQILTPDGKLQIGEEAIVSIALPGSNVVRVQLPEGYLIRAAIRVNANNLQRGTLYCSLAIIRSPFTQNIRTVIAEGFVGQNVNIAWPYGYSEPSISGQGRLAIRTLSNPAAGAEVIYVPGQDQRSRILGLVATLTTAVAVANRLVQFIIDDGVNIAVLGVASAVQAASLTVQYTLSPGLSSQAAVGGDQVVGIAAPAMMAINWRIKTLTQNIQAADQWSAISLGVEEWVEA